MEKKNVICKRSKPLDKCLTEMRKPQKKFVADQSLINRIRCTVPSEFNMCEKLCHALHLMCCLFRFSFVDVQNKQINK